MTAGHAEVFSVGERVAVAGPLFDNGADLAVLDPATVTGVSVRRGDGVVDIDLGRSAQAPPAVAADAVRLAGRVAHRAWRTPLRVAGAIPVVERALLADGFRRDGAGDWRRPAGDFLRTGRKATTFEDVYHDPLSVPWNFAPCEVDVYRELRESPPRHLLDLGCGFGKNSRILHRWGHRVAAVDVAVTAIDQCRRFVPGVVFAVASGAGLPFSDDTFDAVVDVGCLHCVPDELRYPVVAEVARVLRPGGVLYSRIFKPRPEEWLGAQPFVTTGLGLDDRAAFSLLGTHFEVGRPEPHPDMHFLRCVRLVGQP